ncbi:MAG: hypothetical protein CSA32_03520 [Desulfobulbus propionicus]|nr:MAG: hypothetical protein CSA32_03520 [Desulfobulbus propionicus]
MAYKTKKYWHKALPAFFVRHYRRFMVFCEVVSDLSAIFLGVFAGRFLYASFHESCFVWSSSFYMAGTLALCGSLLFERLGLYQKQISLMNLIEVRKIIRSLCLLFVLLLLYSVYVNNKPSELILYAFAFTLLFVLSERMLFFKLQQALHKKGVNVRRVLILGAGKTGRLLYQNLMDNPKLGCRVVGFLDEDKDTLEAARKSLKKDNNNLYLFDNFDNLPRLLQQSEAEEVYLCNPLLGGNYSELRTLSTICKENGARFYFSPYLRGVYGKRLKIFDIGGLPMIAIEESPMSQAEVISKRVFDFLLSLLALVVLAPVLVIIACKIRKDSPGPVIFSQDRVGKDGIIFSMYKFRTMYTDTPVYSKSPRSSQDPRITKVGRILRKISLDELPQLFNVLKGEMSLVGPRPEMPFIVENEYDDLCRERLRVKPGITGIWQISGDRTREIHENISYDIFYIENRSFLLDIIILARTLIFGIMAMKTH